MKPQEEWRSIAGYEGVYEVSSFGQVRSLDRTVFMPRPRRAGGRPYTRLVKGKHLAQTVCQSNGYLVVSLNKDGLAKTCSVHVLVCEAFHGPRPARSVVAHVDGQKYNNAAVNTRYATYIENAADRTAHGTNPAGERNGSALLTEAAARTIKYAPAGSCLKELAGQFQVSVACVRSIRLGDRWKHI